MPARRRRKSGTKLAIVRTYTAASWTSIDGRRIDRVVSAAAVQGAVRKSKEDFMTVF